MGEIYKIRELSDCFRVKALLTVFHKSFSRDYKFKGEIHNFWEIVYLLDGSVGITADDQIETLEKGQLVIHKPGEFHNIWSSKDTNPEVFIITFMLDREVEVLENTIITLNEKAKDILHFLIKETEEMETLYDHKKKVSEIIWKGERLFAADQSIKNYLELFLIEIARNKHRSSYLPIKKDKRAETYEYIIAYIHANLFTPLDVESICVACHVSRSTLKNLFKKYAAIGVMEYVNKLKINRSMQLLSQGVSSKEIADTLQYSSPYYFSYVFKKVVGVSPTTYKKLYKNEKITYLK